MAEIVDDKKIFSLKEVAVSIQKTLAARYATSFWVKAEMNKLNAYPHSGHCYPDLVEKEHGKVIAQLKSTLWRDDYIRINRNFLNLVKTPLQDGVRILFCAKITFDPVHGLALRILDIDPAFSLGELEREKQACIARLQQEGIFERNKSLSFPLLPKRLAIISVQTSKGLADFLKIIGGNAWGYAFSHMLFPSLLQGDRAVESIRYQLDRIRKVAVHFDVVAIIRGGGGEVGLSCFNDYRLAKDIAMFPIPVITGIGHATNETVVEMVAYKNAITPSELADFLLQKFHHFSLPVQKAEELIGAKARHILKEARARLQHAVRYFRSLTNNVLISGKHEVGQCTRELVKQTGLALMRQKRAQTSVASNLRARSLALCTGRQHEVREQSLMLRKDLTRFFRTEDSMIDHLAKTVANLHPENVLKRGYTITRIDGKAVTRIREAADGQFLETILADGSVVSQVTKTIPKSQEE